MTLLYCSISRSMSCLLNQLNNGAEGGSLESGAKVAVMAFADDLVLLQDDSVLGLATLSKAENYLNGCGMELNPRKCAALTYAKIDDRIMARSTPIHEVAGHKIPSISAINPYRYLGRDLNASGLTNLPTWLNRLEKASLKPAQKFQLLKQFIVPKIFYLLHVLFMRCCARLTALLKNQRSGFFTSVRTHLTVPSKPASEMEALG